MTSTKIKGQCWCGAGLDGDPRPMKVEIDPTSMRDARIERLVRTAGHFGPWCSREFAEAGLEDNVYEPDPTPIPPDDVLEAAADVETAQTAFDLADRAWADAAAEHRSVGMHTGQVMVRLDGGPIQKDAKDEARRAELERLADEAWRAREDAGEALRRAKVAHRKAQRVWKNRLRGTAASNRN